MSSSATSRLSTSALGIRPEELEALLWVRDALDPDCSRVELPRWMRFDMNTWVRYKTDRDAGITASGGYFCKTFCCIGGTMAAYQAGLIEQLGSTDEVVPILSGQGHFASEDSAALGELFYNYPDNVDDWTTEENRRRAVAAIDRFLAGNTRDPWLVAK